jgi:hypothetical protein
MEVVIDFEYLNGRQWDGRHGTLSDGRQRVTDTFRFESPYATIPDGSEENGLNWDDGHIAQQIIHGRKRGDGGISSDLQLRRFKMQISLRIIGAPVTQSASL